MTTQEVHSHVIPTLNQTTGAMTSTGDVNRSNITGRPIYTGALDSNGNMIMERYLPSDAKTVGGRILEGGIIQIFTNGIWQRTGN